jgi:hypothetical protein
MLQSLTFEEFAQLVVECPATIENYVEVPTRYNWKQSQWQPCGSSEVTRETRLRGDRVETGGAAGGSCWGGVAHSYSVSDAHPELSDLDVILEKVWPEITYLQYKSLLREAKVSEDTDTVHDYYGNYTDYVFKVVKLGDLYDALMGMMG